MANNKIYMVIRKMIRYGYEQALPKALSFVEGGTVVAIGNFDGVHLGHQAMLRSAVTLAEREQLPPIVVTFDPHPTAVIPGAKPKPLLTTLTERTHYIEDLDIRACVVCDFTPQLSMLDAAAFCRQVLVERLKMRFLCAGEGFRLGHDRLGGKEDLEAIGGKLDFKVSLLPSEQLDGKAISSSRIRRLLAEGDVTAAARLLGRRYAIAGNVVDGAKRGRELGFPTANLRQEGGERLIPGRGVFATLATIGGKTYGAVTNIGLRPTVGDSVQQYIETHLLNFSEDLYGEMLTIEFLKRIRDEKKFASVDELKQAIEEDIIVANGIFVTLENIVNINS